MTINDTTRRYSDDRFDSARWREFPLRGGDIVVSAPAKAGTTWLQRICALLVFQHDELPAPLDDLSPWLDMRMVPLEAVTAQLERQQHRRFIKTHTPLDGLPLRPDVTYLVGARHPLDVAVSLYHQWRNIDLDAVRTALGITAAEMPDPPDVPVEAWLSVWIDEDADDLHSLRNVVGHVADAWARRHAPNVVLAHYADLRTDLAGQMRRLAVRLDIDVPEQRWPALVEAATFGAMRADAERLAPRVVPLLSRAAFFREGRSGAGVRAAGPAGLARFRDRVAPMVSPELYRWLCRP
ncbi:sulfotransferase [Virgisporangium aliadipatigenens]|uniref:Sulfotransferase n=1 Tax=Virgisporangium aliadipatigenens TaxID=741659 RepID=A0A8J3YGV4_9ACTN|nr:sulfotransferase domain-containing protein [Virgisporangium aliadipatigenens]GIJ43770.1 sulfotransferase [Virgisporangium aliadipatigenens]